MKKGYNRARRAAASDSTGAEMFGNCLNVRIRAAEKALLQGRFDEAYACAARPEVQAASRGQKLLDDLARPLLARARLHAQAGRFREALDDLDKLDLLGRTGGDADALRQRVVAELKDRHERRADAHDAEARAADDLRAGRLESGRLAIARVDDSVRREQLQEELDARVERSAQLLEQARAALAGGDLLAAIRLWDEAVTRQGRSAASDALASQTSAALRTTLDGWFSEGRLARVETTLAAAAGLRRLDPALGEFQTLVDACRAAADALARGDWAALRKRLLRIVALRGPLPWVQQALDAAAEIATTYERLTASPLGAFAPVSHAAAAKVPAGERLPAPPRPARDGSPAVTTAARDEALALHGAPLLLLIDGTGSSLLLFRERIRIGRLGGDAVVDVPIPGDLHSHHADVFRDGDDYFLLAHGPARVNSREVRKALLRDGDRVQLGGAKFTFRRPSAKTGTAVLSLADRSRLPHDVSHVLLFRDACVIGPQLHAHIRTREGQSRLVIFEHEGGLRIRPTTPDGRPQGPGQVLPLRKTCEFGDVRLTAAPYDAPERSHTV